MHILNRHERRLSASPAQVGALIDGLASPQDRLWPRQTWPRMSFDRPLGVGAVGGHGPIRYTVEAYTPGQFIRFRFTAPEGFHGWHGYDVQPLDAHTALLIHMLEMDTSGPALLSWPLVFRPLHDALIEDSLDNAERGLHGQIARPARWSPIVRLLRTLLQRPPRWDRATV